MAGTNQTDKTRGEAKHEQDQILNKITTTRNTE